MWIHWESGCPPQLPQPLLQGEGFSYLPLHLFILQSSRLCRKWTRRPFGWRGTPMARCFSTITQTAGASARLFLVFQNLSSVINTFFYFFYSVWYHFAANSNHYFRYYCSCCKRFFWQRCNNGGGQPAGGAGEDREEGACGFPGVGAAESSSQQGSDNRNPSFAGRSTRRSSESRQKLKITMRSVKCQPCSLCIYRRLSQRGPPSAKAEVTGKWFEGWFSLGKVEFCPSCPYLNQEGKPSFAVSFIQKCWMQPYLNVLSYR